MVAEQDVYFDAEVSLFKMHDGTSLRDLSASVKELRGIPGQMKVNDKTTFGSVGERPALSIMVAHFSIEFLFNMITDIGVHPLIATMWATKVARLYEYYPAGEVAGNAKFTGNAYCPIYEITSRVGDIVAVHAEFISDNGITVGVK